VSQPKGPVETSRGLGDHREPLSRGLIAGRYALYDEIAAGGMAAVHLGRQLGAAGFARTVAIKRLHGGLAKDPNFVAMFLDEARLVARIRHPNVVPTLDVVSTDEELFIVMDYVHGESLLRLLQAAQRARVRVAPSIAASIVASVLHGLHAAHEAVSETGEPLGMVHRDVSPHNVLVGTDGVPRVLDFGIAKATQRVQTTRQGQLKGKLAYMAPEQLQDGRADRRTDVYAAAVVLWESLVGQRLFDGDSEGAIVTKVLAARTSAPSLLVPDVSPRIDAVVMRGLAPDPARRFATAREMALAIEAAGPLASASELGAWVASLARDGLAKRSAAVAEMEAESSRSNVELAVNSLRSIAEGTPLPALPFLPTMPSPRVSSAPPEGAPRSPRPPAPPGSGAPLAIDHSTSASLALPRRQDPPWTRAPLVAGTIATALLAIALGAFIVVRGHLARTAPSPAPPFGGEAAAPPPDAPFAVPAAAPPPGCPEGMNAIPGGRFFMGSDDDLPLERPAHQVTLAPFCIDVFEVTTETYGRCSDRGECKRAGQTNRWAQITPAERKSFDPQCNGKDPERAQHPINCVDWEMADRFCRIAGKRLPTEAEWEFAARGPDGRMYPWGDEPPSALRLNACGTECVAWGKQHGALEEAMYAQDDGWPTTAPVGSFPAGKSRYGIQDVVGNVWEWTADRYAPYTPAEEVNPTGPAKGEERVIRGGSWNGAQPAWVRPTFRYKNDPSTRSYGIGFRCAKSL